MANQEQIKLQFAQQRENISRQVQAERPSVATLMSRGMAELPQIRESQRQQTLVAREALSRLQTQEQTAIKSSPEYQRWAYNEAKRLIESGAPASFASDPDVKHYYYEIQKNPEAFHQLRVGETQYKREEGLFEPIITTKEITISQESKVSDLLKQGITKEQLWDIGKEMSVQRKAQEEFIEGKISVSEAIQRGVTKEQIVEIGKNISTIRRIDEELAKAPKVDVSTPFSRFLIKVDKSLGFLPKDENKTFYQKSIEKAQKTYLSAEGKLSPLVTKAVESSLIFGKMKPYEEAIKTKYPILPAGMFGLYYPNPPKVAYETIRGELTELKEHPVKVAGTTALWFLGSEVLGLAGKGVSAFGKATGISPMLSTTTRTTVPSLFMAKVSPSQIWTGVKIAGATALAALYTKSIVKRIQASPEGQKSFTFGRIMMGEVQPMVIGSYLGAVTFPEIKGRLRTLGRTEIPKSELIPRDVDIMGGAKRFPEAPRGQHLRLFLSESQRIPEYNEPMMYHQTGQQWWKGGKGFEVSYVPEMESSEFKGLYGSYGVSPYFLKIGGANYKVLGYDFLPSTPSPATAVVIPTKFVKGVISKLGEAFVPSIKTEVEAILPIGTVAEPLSQKYFYTIQGVRIPLDIFRTVTGEGATKLISKGIVSPSSYIGASTSIISPSQLLTSYSLRLSYEPLKISSEILTTPSSSMKISEISSKISYKPSSFKYEPSYKPSYKTSEAVSVSSYIPYQISSRISYKPSSSLSYPRETSSSSDYLRRYFYPPRYVSSLSRKGISLSKVGGYKVFVKRKGKFRALEGIFPRYKAIRLGEKRAMETLVRTFRIEKAKGEILDISPKEEIPSPKIFRAYKIKGGKQIPLKDEWIQRAKYSLSARSEVSEIQRARKSKLRGGFFI